MDVEPGDRMPEARVSDEERAGVVELLRASTTDGYLTLDEFSERVGVALAARNRAELTQVSADLPAPATAGDGALRVTRRTKVTRWVVAVMGGTGRTGRWRTGSQVTAIAVMGGCHIDFRRAEFENDEIIVTAVALMGGIHITVPEGIAVELTGMPIMGGKQLRVADVPILPGSPRIVVRAFPVMGGVEVRSRPNRATGDGGVSASVIEREMEAGDRPVAALGRAPGLDLEMEALKERTARSRQRMERRTRRDEDRSQRRQREGRPGDAGSPRGGRSSRPFDRLQADIDRHLGPGASEILADVVGPAVASYGRRWGIQLERGEESHLPADQALRAVPAAPDGTVTILFSDICGYTEMTERLGDHRAHELVSAYQQIVRGQLAAYGGYEVKVQGDGFMLAFAGASRALRCALAIQRAMDDYGKDHTDEPIRVHQGLHTGEAVRENGDFLGRTVILASRIAGEAGESEILVSSLLRELADGAKEFRFGEGRTVTLKGVSADQTVYPVEWRVSR